MTHHDIISAQPGSRFLIACAEDAQEEMVASISEAALVRFKHRTALNTSPIAAMDMGPDENPNRFSDLLGLCGKLVTAAGRRSHFEGLLLLNISDLIHLPANATRLKGLGEWLTIPNGLTSKCITVLYGPKSEEDLLVCADLLDFDAKLKVGRYEMPMHDKTLKELLDEASIRCDSPEVEQLLESTIGDMHTYANFYPDKFLKACANKRGYITTNTLTEVLEDPFSYINRIKKSKEHQLQTSGRKIGFRERAD